MVTDKKNLRYTVSVPAEGNTVKDITDAQKLVGATTAAQVNIGTAPVSYVDDGEGNQVPSGQPFLITLSWEEEK